MNFSPFLSALVTNAAFTITFLTERFLINSTLCKHESIFHFMVFKGFLFSKLIVFPIGEYNLIHRNQICPILSWAAPEQV